jgi:hypothetical protein
VCSGSGCIVRMGFGVGFESMGVVFSGTHHERGVFVLLFCSAAPFQLFAENGSMCVFHRDSVCSGMCSSTHHGCLLMTLKERKIM